MSRDRELRIAPAARFSSDESAPLVRYTGVMRNATAGAAASTPARVELPPDAEVIEVRATDTVRIRFGDSGVQAAAADENCKLLLAGEKIMVTPYIPGTTQYATHFAAIRVGSNDVAMQVEGVVVD